MPLSEDDQRKLDQIEQALTKDDPQFAETIEHRSVAAPPDRAGPRLVHHRDGGPDRGSGHHPGSLGARRHHQHRGALTMTAATAVFLRGRQWP